MGPRKPPPSSGALPPKLVGTDRPYDVLNDDRPHGALYALLSSPPKYLIGITVRPYWPPPPRWVRVRVRVRRGRLARERQARERRARDRRVGCRRADLRRRRVEVVAVRNFERGIWTR